MKTELQEVLVQAYEVEQSSRYLMCEMPQLIELVKTGYLEVHQEDKKNWEKRLKQSYSSSQDPHIGFQLTDKGVKALKKCRDDYDKGWRHVIVKVKPSDNIYKPKELFVGDIITGRFQERESSRDGYFYGDEYEEDEDGENRIHYTEFTGDVRTYVDEDYVTIHTPGEVKTAQVTWTSETGREFLYGVVDLSDGKQMCTANSLAAIREYIEGVFWDWRVMIPGEKVTLTVGETKKDK